MRTVLRYLVILAILLTTAQSLLAQDQILRGDCNADTVIDAGDVSALAIALTGGLSDTSSCDVNGDTLLNQADVLCLQAKLFSLNAACQTVAIGQSFALVELSGDCNADGLVDAGDIAALAQHAGTAAGGTGSSCDLDTNGLISDEDAALVRRIIFQE
jgi:hypothetical protein